MTTFQKWVIALVATAVLILGFATFIVVKRIGEVRERERFLERQARCVAQLGVGGAIPRSTALLFCDTNEEIDRVLGN